MSTKNNPVIQNIVQAYKDIEGPNARLHSQKALNWFTKYIRKNYNKMRMPRMMKDGNFLSSPVIGDMYLFDYSNPKYKDTLPYYDRYPLIFMMDYQENGNYLGINLHYLPPRLRMVLFLELMKIRNEKRYRRSTKLKLSYAVLKSFSKFSLAAPTIHAYIPNRVQSKFIRIDPEIWPVMLQMPLERFEKASKSKVWSDSLKKSRS